MKHARFALILGGMLLLLGLGLLIPRTQTAQAQQPTGSIPTVTSTPLGPMVTVYQDLEIINVYAGPDMYLYPPVGVLLRGQSVPALGRSAYTDWIMIAYPTGPDGVAWVYAPWVSLSPGFLPTVTPPPTPTPFATFALNLRWPPLMQKACSQHHCQPSPLPHHWKFPNSQNQRAHRPRSLWGWPFCSSP
jgi:hypothetical protein